MEYTIRFTDEGREVRVPAGTTLLEARIRARLEADAPCGGRGSCGKCRCETRAEGEAEWREALMCQTPVAGDMEVRAVGAGRALRVLQSILKEISPGCSLEGLVLKLKLQYFGHLMRRIDSLKKTLMLGEACKSSTLQRAGSAA